MFLCQKSGAIIEKFIMVDILDKMFYVYRGKEVADESYRYDN